MKDIALALFFTQEQLKDKSENRNAIFLKFTFANDKTLKYAPDNAPYNWMSNDSHFYFCTTY